MEERRLHVSNRLKSLLSYRKMAGTRPRMLILESQYWLDSACRRAARRLGWEVARVPTRMEGMLPRELVAELIETLGAFRPDFILTINLSGMDEHGLFGRLFMDLEIPLVTWFVDDPRTIMLDRDCYGSAWSLALTWERAYIPYLRARGFGEVHWMPLAADADLFPGDTEAEAESPPAFVGNSMVEPAAQERVWIAARPALEARVDGALRVGRVTRANFGRGLGAMLGEDGVATLDEHERRHAEIYCFVEGTRRLRAETVSALAPEGLWVYGDAHWQSIAPQCGAYLDYEKDLAAFYRRCAVNLNITSIQMPTALNQRVFDCPAAGGFLLTDAQEDLGELFDIGNETASYSGVEEARDRLRYFLQHPEARNATRRRAHARVVGEHTYVHRLLRIAELVRNRFGG